MLGRWSGRFIMAAGLKVGDILCNRYPIEGILGEGGMGAVYRASDLSSKRHWAVKEMTDNFDSQVDRAEAVRSFKAEADILCDLEHPNLPRITHCFSERGRQYIVMDLVTGDTVEKLLRNSPQGRLSLEEIADITRQLVDVLEYLHTHEPPIIFRDLKPANIMVMAKHVVKLIDFGIARFFTKGKRTDTVALGTPGYAAPEQYGSGQSDARTDIYALGATLHQCLTGVDPSAVPFKFDPPSVLVPDLPKELDEVILKCVNMDPAQRWASVEEFGQAFAQVYAATGGNFVGNYAGAGVSVGLGKTGNTAGMRSVGSWHTATGAVQSGAIRTNSFDASGSGSVSAGTGRTQAPYAGAGNNTTVPTTGVTRGGGIDLLNLPQNGAHRSEATENTYGQTVASGAVSAAGRTGQHRAVSGAFVDAPSNREDEAEPVTTAGAVRRGRTFPRSQIDFGSRNGDTTYKTSITLNGEVDGELVCSDKWLVCRPSYVKGNNVKVDVFVDPSKIRNAGFNTGFVRLGNESMAVSISLKAETLGCFTWIASISLMLTSWIPFWGLIVAVILGVWSWFIPKRVREPVFIFFVISLLLGLGASTLVSYWIFTNY